MIQIHPNSDPKTVHQTRRPAKPILLSPFIPDPDPLCASFLSLSPLTPNFDPKDTDPNSDSTSTSKPEYSFATNFSERTVKNGTPPSASKHRRTESVPASPSHSLPTNDSQQTSRRSQNPYGELEYRPRPRNPAREPLPSSNPNKGSSSNAESNAEHAQHSLPHTVSKHKRADSVPTSPSLSIRAPESPSWGSRHPHDGEVQQRSRPHGPRSPQESRPYNYEEGAQTEAEAREHRPRRVTLEDDLPSIPTQLEILPASTSTSKIPFPATASTKTTSPIGRAPMSKFRLDIHAEEESMEMEGMMGAGTLAADRNGGRTQPVFYLYREESDYDSDSESDSGSDDEEAENPIRHSLPTEHNHRSTPERAHIRAQCAGKLTSTHLRLTYTKPRTWGRLAMLSWRNGRGGRVGEGRARALMMMGYLPDGTRTNRKRVSVSSVARQSISGPVPRNFRTSLNSPSAAKMTSSASNRFSLPLPPRVPVSRDRTSLVIMPRASTSQRTTPGSSPRHSFGSGPTPSPRSSRRISTSTASGLEDRPGNGSPMKRMFHRVSKSVDVSPSSGKMPSPSNIPGIPSPSPTPSPGVARPRLSESSPYSIASSSRGPRDEVRAPPIPKLPQTQIPAQTGPKSSMDATVRSEPTGLPPPSRGPADPWTAAFGTTLLPSLHPEGKGKGPEAIGVTKEKESEGRKSGLRSLFKRKKSRARSISPSSRAAILGNGAGNSSKAAGQP